MKHVRIMVALCVLLFSGSILAQDNCCEVGGDADHNGQVSITDAVFIINYIFGGGPQPACFAEADADGNGQTSITDAVYIINYIFGGGPPPAECPPAAHIVFQDEYGSDVTYEAYAGSKLDAVEVSADSAYAGTQGLEITIPGADPWWSGGAFTDSTDRDLSGFNALTLWVKASQAATIDAFGLGDDNTGTSKYKAEVVGGLAVTTDWQQYVIPVPLPEKLTAEGGLCFFAEGFEGADPYLIWMDEILYDSVTTITNPRPAITSQTIEVNSGETVAPGNGTVIFDVDGTDMTLSIMPGYFTFYSSDPGVVSIGGDGTITAVGEGTATLTADLGPTAATGSITVNVTAAEPVPGSPAPTPTQDPADVISLFSDAYTDVTVDTWSAPWDMADVTDYAIGSDNTKKYTNLVFAGIEFTSSPIDASTMTHFRIDVWTPDPTAAPSVFKVKLVDAGADGVVGTGGDDSEHELTFDENTMATESWVSIDVPLASFSGLSSTAHLAQLIISGDPNTVYVDNVYFYDSGAPLEPTTPAPTPTEDPGDVISLYSDAYTDVTVDTWSAVWDQADVTDVVIGSDNAKKYTNLVFAGIELTSSPVDASLMTHFHMDVWTPDPTAAPAVFKVKLVDAGADGVIGTGGDDSEHELWFDHTTMNTGLWTSIDVPLSDFTGLAARGHLAQLIISGDPNTVYVDNVYFYDSGTSTVPLAPAPTPTLSASDVISLFSDAYTDVTVDTWSAPWDQADVADYMVGSDNTKQYTNLVYAGIEFYQVSTVDASTMTHFHMDVWTPDPTAAPAVFKIKLVDLGADGAFGGGDDVEHEVILDENTMNSGGWVSIELPLTDFVNLTTRAHLAQMIISGDPNTVFVDNVYFHK